MEFVNRREELDALDRLYRAGGFQFVPLYGRRRVGKTRLVQEFIKDKPALYFLADSVSESEQLRNLGRLAGEHFQDAILVDSGFRDWYQFFRYLKEKAGKRRVIVIDEFPYLVNSNRAISSIFQKGIDEYLKNTGVFLILMGSSVGMMEKEVLFYKAPLYGRRTSSLEIREMPFDALHGFFPGADFDTLLNIYSVFGTIPAYLEKVSPRRDMAKSIGALLLDRSSFFYNEVEFILREELREPRNYFVILKALAEGNRKLSEIINQTGFDKGLVSRYLDILRGLRFVEKETPVTDQAPEKSKQGLYRLHDKFFAFWFKYIFPNRGRIEIGNAEYVLKAIRGTFDLHVAGSYEDACRDICKRLMADGALQFTALGKWWSRNEELDLVALDEESGTIYFGECTWSAKKVGEDVYRDLPRKAALVDWRHKKRAEKFMLFSKSGFTDGMIATAGKEGVLLLHKDKVVQRKGF